MIIIIIVVIIILSYFIYPTPPLYGAFQIIYQAWDTVFYHQMKHWEESWKCDVQQVFLTNFEEHCVECLILPFKQSDFIRRN